MQHVNQQGTTRRSALRAGAAAGTAAALGAAGILAAGTADAAATAVSGSQGLPCPSGVTDTSHCAPGAAKIFRGFFTAKSQHDLTALMSYFSQANTTYIDACLGISLPSWQAVASTFGPVFASAPASAVYPADFKDAEENADPAVVQAAKKLQAAFAAGHAAAAVALMSYDVVHEDIAAHTRLRGQLQAQRYYTRALGQLPYGPGAALVHAEGSQPLELLRLPVPGRPCRGSAAVLRTAATASQVKSRKTTKGI
jgi:hypothetical protein